MTDPFRYRPYVDVAPFSIGLSPLRPDRWIEPDEFLAAELEVKEAILTSQRDIAVRAEDGTEASQREVLDLLVDHLIAQHGDRYERCGDGVVVKPAQRMITLSNDAPNPLVTAARLVQDDLVLMRRGADSWRLAAAVLTAPSAWSLAEKFGQSLDGIHDNVPGYAGRMATLLARIFDNLQAGKPVCRLNWSLYDDDVLFHPESKAKPRRWAGADGRFGEQAFIRVERQTLTRLPVSGDILFTIRVYVDPVAAFRTHPDGSVLAGRLADRLAGMDQAQLKYKGLLADRDRVLEALRAL